MSLADFWSLPASEQIQQYNRASGKHANVNPCIDQFGAGPAYKHCGDCIHMFSKRYDKTYWKCELRKNTNGAGSDHRKKWDACAKFEQK